MTHRLSPSIPSPAARRPAARRPARPAGTRALGRGGVPLCLAGLLALLVTTSEPARADPRSWQVIAAEADAVARFERALARARKAKSPVMIDFFAEWCVACQKLDVTTFADPAVRTEAARFVAIKVDATEDTPGLEELQRRYGVVGLPTVVFLSSEGEALAAPRVTGFVGPSEYLSLMRAVR